MRLWSGRQGERRRTTPLSSHADVRSIDALKDFRAVLALYAEEAQGALGAVKMEAQAVTQLAPSRPQDLLVGADQAKSRGRGLGPSGSGPPSTRQDARAHPGHERAERAAPQGRGPAPRSRDEGGLDQEVGARLATGGPRTARQHPTDWRPFRDRRRSRLDAPRPADRRARSVSSARLRRPDLARQGLQAMEAIAAAIVAEEAAKDAEVEGRPRPPESESEPDSPPQDGA